MTKKNEVQINRRDSDDPRDTEDRRQSDQAVAENRRDGERRKVQRRRQIDPTTCERDYTEDEIEFMQALDDYKRANGRMFPTCSEILEVIRGLGYDKVASIEIVESVPAELGLVTDEEETEEAEEVVI